MEKEELDPIRELILRKSRETGVTLAEISRVAERNEAYMHQFVHRGSPRILPENVRRITSMLLGIPEDELKTEPVPKALRKGQSAGRLTDRTGSGQTGNQGGDAPATARPLPVFNIGDSLESDAREHTPCPPFLAGISGAFAVWTGEAAGRLLPGDLAYVRPNQPPRPGDTVALVDDGRVILLGELEKSGGSTRVVTCGGVIAEPPEGARLMKVVGSFFG